MAKNYSEVYSAVYTKGNSMSFGNAMLRGNGVPLDITEVYDSYNKAVLYAAENAVAYEGQLLAVTENGDTTVYVITPALQETISIDVAGDGVTKDVPVYIKEIGSVPQADGKTIELVDGVLTLVGTGDLDSSKTYQPVFVDGKIEWREPSATTVEGLDTRLTEAEEKISDIETAIGDAASGLVKDVADNAAAIKALEDSANAFEGADETLHNTIKDEIAEALAAAKKYADDNDADTIYDDTQVKADIEAAQGRADAAYDKAGEAAAAVLSEAEARESADNALRTELQGYVAEQIAKEAHFSTKIVTSVDEMTDAATLYLIKTAETGDDLYEEWMVIEGVATKIGTTSTDLTDYATTESVTAALSDLQDELEAQITALGEAHDADIEELSGEVEGLTTTVNEFKSEVSTTYETKSDATAKQETLQGAIDALTDEVALKAVKADVDAAIKSASDAAAGAQATADANAGEITKLQNVDAGFETRIGNLEQVGAEKNVVADVSEEFELSADRKLSVKAIDQSKVTGLTEAIEGLQDTKVDKKTSMYDGKETEWTLLSPENAAKLGALTIGDTGNIEISGKVNAENVEGLASYITGGRDSIAGLYPSSDATKLAGIATGAQVNVIEKIKINGAELTVGADKSVNIPFATNNTIGVVLSSEDENKIAVGADGTMEVNSLNVNKLVQTDGDTLILNGGHA